MALELTPDVRIRRDNSGKVRQLTHARQYQPAAGELFSNGLSTSLTPRTLAEQYLRETAPVFEFSPGETANFSAAIGVSPTEAGVELRFKEEKAVGTSVSVAYDQTLHGLPIWDAGVTVRIDSKQMGVTGSHNATHYDIEAKRPTADALFLQNSITKEKLLELLGLAQQTDVTINATRALVYRFRLAERLSSQVKAHQKADDFVGLGGSEKVEFPTLVLPPLPDSIEEGKHYVVTEVLFKYEYPNWGPLNWRVFVEPETGAILYLRALVSCARGAVFKADPVTITGKLYGADTSSALLDEARNTVSLLGLTVPSSIESPLELQGEYVRLVNLKPPGTPMPSENSPYDFLYPCNTENFAACNAYHHCDGVFRLIQGMGIDVNSYFNNTDFPVPVDPHAYSDESSSVNAAANGNVLGNGLGSLVFGVAKPGSSFGISADLRVVLHEFGHALLWDHVGSPNFGFAHSPGDSLAAILLDPHSKAPDRFETFPFMKQSSGLSRRHNRSVDEGWGWFGHQWDTQYAGEQVLSTTMFRIYRAAGGDSLNVTEKEFASRYRT